LQKLKLNPYFFIFIVFIIAFLPIISFVFGVKNDILTGYLPVKFFMSESISDGHFPWWNPYVNFGLPQHADMSSGFWNPITWLISLTTGYSVYSITLELLLYIFIAGVGMYKVTGLWKLDNNIKLIAAVSYMCSGYTIGHIQHINWISGAAFLPWCFFSYMIMLKGFSFYRIAIAVCCFYFLISSSHPGLIIGSLYFFVILSIYQLINTYTKSNSGNTSIRIQLFILAVFFLLLITILTGMIISYAEILPFITRGNKPAIVNQTTSNTIGSLASFVFPFSTVKNESSVHSPLSLKNFYIGIIPLLFTVSSFFVLKKNKEIGYLLVTGISFLLISVTGTIQILAYKYLPLLSYVRSSREFRIFAIFCFILAGAISLHSFLNSNEKPRFVKPVHWFLVIITSVLFCWSIFKITTTHQSFLFSNITSVPYKNYRDFLKLLSSSFSFYDTIFLQGIFQIILLLLIKKFLFLKNSRALLFICTLDIIVASSLNLPFTGYGEASAGYLQKELDKSPKGIPVPLLQPIILNDTGTVEITKTIGTWSFYNKQPGTVIRSHYPIQFNNERILFSKPVMKYLSLKPFVFFASLDNKHITKQDSSSGPLGTHQKEIQIQRFTPAYIKINLKASSPGRVTLLYQNYPHWKVFINEKESATPSGSDDFIHIDIPSEGSYTIEYFYQPVAVKTGLIIGTLILFSLGLFICIKSVPLFSGKKRLLSD
jgi:hypothetical protein